MEFFSCAATVKVGKLTIFFSRAGLMIQEAALVQLRVQELQQYATWTGPKERKREEIASYLVETQGSPDPYEFTIGADAVIDNITGKPIRDFIVRGTYIGDADAMAFERIEQYALNRLPEAYIWISPSYQGVYPSPKIIISEVVQNGNVDVLRNWSIMLNCDDQACVILANSLIGSNIFNDPEQVRISPIRLTVPKNSTWINELSHQLNDPQLQTIENGVALKAKAQALLDAEVLADLLVQGKIGNDTPELIAKMKVISDRGGIGSHGSSCPMQLTAGQLLSINSKELKFVRSCGKCGIPINKLIGAGYQCTNCGGTYEGC